MGRRALARAGRERSGDLLGTAPPASPALTEAALLDGVSAPEQEGIARLFAERFFPRGRVIYARDDPSDALSILKSGLVKLLTESQKGRETRLHLLKPDAIFGELLLSEERRAFTAVAATDVAVEALSRKRFRELLAACPAVALNFSRVLSRRLAEVERVVADFGHTWSYHRLARTLLRLATEHGVAAPGGTLIPLALTHAELANMIGTTRETVTAQLVRFRRLGLLTREGRHVVVDCAGLADFIRSEETRIHRFHAEGAPPGDGGGRRDFGTAA